MVDRFTKVVLTVIAGALVWLCLWGPGPNWGTPAEAQTYRVKPPLEVNIGQIGGKDVDQIRAGRYEASAENGLPIRIVKPTCSRGEVEIEGTVRVRE